MSKDWIVVGVDGTNGGDAAVRWAAQEASRSGRRVKLLHVAPQLAESVALEGELPPTGEQAHERMLVEAAATVRRTLGDAAPDRVLTEVALGGRSAHLLAAGADGSLLVLGRSSHRLLDRLARSHIRTKVTARARVPVVVVPAEASGAGDGPVVLGVKDLDSGEQLIDRAMALAAERGARLILLHAWQVPVLSDDLEASRSLQAEDRARQKLMELRRLRTRRHERRLGVPVRIDVLHGRADEVLAAATATAAMVVLGRDPLANARGHLGATSRYVLRKSRCPVVVMPLGATGQGESGVLGRAGATLQAAAHRRSPLGLASSPQDR